MKRDIRWGPGQEFQSVGPIKTLRKLKQIATELKDAVLPGSRMAAAADYALRSPDTVLGQPHLQEDLLDMWVRYTASVPRNVRLPGSDYKRPRTRRRNPSHAHTRSERIGELRHEGYPAKQAEAIAYREYGENPRENDDGPPNLDDLTPEGLMRFWNRYQRGQHYRELFPKGGKGTRRAAADLANYAANKSVAIKARLRGAVNTALEYERIADSIYEGLPDYAKW